MWKRRCSDVGSSAHDLRKSATVGRNDNVGLKSIITRKLTCVLESVPKESFSAVESSFIQFGLLTRAAVRGKVTNSLEAD